MTDTTVNGAFSALEKDMIAATSDAPLIQSVLNNSKPPHSDMTTQREMADYTAAFTAAAASAAVECPGSQLAMAAVYIAGANTQMQRKSLGRTVSKHH